MSELGNLLEEIKGGKDIVDETETRDDIITTEEIPMNVEEEFSEDINVETISEESMATFRGLHQCNIIVESLVNEVRADKSIVLEAMAGLPKGSSRLEEAKLTNNASIINKDILNSVVGRDSEEINHEFKETVRKLHESLSGYISDISVPLKELDGWVGSLVDIDSASKKHLIIYENETLNLVTRELEAFLAIDWSLVECDEYSTGSIKQVFEQLFFNVSENEYLRKLLSVNDVFEPSLIDIINAFRGPMRSQLSSCVNRISSFYHSVSGYLETSKQIDPEVLNYLETINSDIVLYNNIRNIVSSRESPLGTVTKLLSVLV